MSLARCHYCDKFVDTDEFPDAYPWANDPDASAVHQDLCVCENCQENQAERQQEQLMEESA